MSLKPSYRNAILSKCPALRVVNQYGGNLLYEEPVGHILSGYFVDYGVPTTYFGLVHVPLCDRVSHLGPGFGNRLKESLVARDVPSSPALVADTLKAIVREHRPLVNKTKDVSYFIKHFSRHDSLQNERMARAFGATLIIAEKFAEAEIILLDVLIKSKLVNPKPDWMISFLDDTENILNLMSRSSASAKLLVLEWEEFNKRRFDIPF